MNDESSNWIKLLMRAKNDNSEVLLRQALKAAEDEFAADSPEAGLCLMDLADLFEQSGNLDGVETATTRYRAILCDLARKMGID